MAKMGGLDSAQASAVAGGSETGAIWNRVASRVVHQPSNRGRSAGEVALVDEHARHGARPAVEVLVRAPRREVDVPVVQRERDVAGGVREVPAHDAAGP